MWIIIEIQVNKLKWFLNTTKENNSHCWKLMAQINNRWKEVIGKKKVIGAKQVIGDKKNDEKKQIKNENNINSVKSER